MNNYLLKLFYPCPPWKKKYYKNTVFIEVDISSIPIQTMNSNIDTLSLIDIKTSAAYYSGLFFHNPALFLSGTSAE